jgi:hypothetical protein
MSGRGQIDDRQPPVGESYAGLHIDPDAMVIGTPMRNCAGHLAYDAIFIAGFSPVTDEPGNSTHPLTTR